MDVSRHLMSLVLLAFVLATFFSTALTRHRIRHHRDRFKRQHGAHLYLPESFVTDDDSGGRDAGQWGEWSPPSACSRTCGGGVSTQERRCQYEGGCQGASKKYFSCNTQDCPDDGDYRAEQCSEFDRQPFEGVHYQWVPYTKAPNQCELNCMPRGERFYYRHKMHVADGTRCDAEKMDVCVNGKCQPVGCDMMLGSQAREDKCRQCGGNGTTCNTVTGNVDMQDLQVGYNDILLIPAGATNIIIREVSPSNNYLAIRNLTGHYYLNGNWRIDFPKTLRFAGSNFHYERSPQGFSAPDTITCIGPTYEPLYLVLLYQDINVGVHYEYSIPKAFSSDLETYTWTFHEFSACSVSCGGGYQSRNVSCAGRQTLEMVERNLCDAQTEPPSTQKCGDQPCEPQWLEGEWSECSEVCGEDGIQRREIKCERVIAAGVSSVVNDQFCQDRYGSKPEAMKECNRGIPCPTWFTGPWKPCDHLCGPGKETRQVICYRKVDGKIEILDEAHCIAKESKPESEKQCNFRPCEGVDWISSEWSGCDICGLKSETRKVYCATQKGEVYADDLCEGEQKPDIVRDCEASKACDTQWYASQWSECSAKCGEGIQTRNVFCGTFENDSLKKIEDSSCDETKKYDTLMNCTAKEEVCPGEWFSGPWNKCDKECGSGTRSRKVICMKGEEVIPTSNCDPNLVPFSNEACNTDSCGKDEVLPVDTTKPVEDSDDISTTEPDLDRDVESVDEDEECEDGEWVYEYEKELETFGKLVAEEAPTPFGSSLSTGSTTETSWFSEDLMLSDSTDDTREIDLTSEGSGDFISPIDSSSTISGPTDSSTETTIEGSGDSTVFETTVSGALDTATALPSSDLSIGSSDSTSPGSVESTDISDASPDSTDASSDSTEASPATTDSTPDNTDSTVKSPDSTDFVDITDGSTNANPTDISTTDKSPTDISSDNTDASPASTDGSTDASPASTDDSTDASPVSTDGSTDASPASTDDSTDASPVSTDDSTDASPTSTDESTDASPTSTDDSTDSSDVNSVNTDVPASTDSSSDSSDSTDTTTGNSDSTDVSLTSSDLSSDSSDSSTDSVTSPTPTETTEDSTSDSTIETTSISTQITSESTDLTSYVTSSDLTSDVTSSDLTSDVTSSDLTSDSSDSTTESSDLTTEPSDLTTDSTDLTSDSSDLTTVAQTNITSEESDEIAFGESDYGAEQFGITAKPEVSKITEDISTVPSITKETSDSSDYTTETTLSGFIETDLTTESGMTTEISSAATESTISGSTEENISTESTASGMTTESTLSEISVDTTVTDLTESSAATESTISGSTEEKLSTESTASGMTTETTLFEISVDTTVTDLTESSAATESTISGSTEEKLSTEPTASGMTTESEGTTEELSTVSETFTVEVSTVEVSIETEMSTESGPTEITSEIGSTSETESTVFDIWSTTESGMTSETWETTPYTIESITKKRTKFCKRKRPSCETKPFGCCSDLVTAAEGPFDKGCRTPKTCNDTKFGCCEDGVSPAQGPKLKGCPVSQCAETLFGCCPDDKIPAEGNDFEGCKQEPPPPECLASKFGCCDDNSIAATGPDGKGCKECELSEFGCCPDGVQSAIGENQEGCEPVLLGITQTPVEEDCSNSTYGCCPDGETTALGEHFQGCDILNQDNCTLSYFGCCPDGVAPAHGPENKGCRAACEDERYGCCSDQVTAAHGPNQEGCCLAHPYGCCPDNILSARGPNLEGCGCQYSPYGCCPDNQTAARGYGNEGCGCDHTEHGCCPDRYTPAIGADNQGCACHTFQFGCCPDGFSIAKGPHKQGCGCRNTEYGCCSDDQTPAQGENLAGCDCSSSKHGCCPDGLTDAQGDNFDGCTDVPVNKQESCIQEKDRGSCRNYTVKWFFDMQYGGCSRFWYGGCDGNSNRFTSMEECKNICVEPQGKEICQLSKVTGACEGYFPSWYYDKDRKQCGQFIWGGCLGNANRFETREECQSLCAVDKDQDACEQPREEGPCRGSYRRWSFNKETNECEMFAYGGCKANNNNFPTELACKQQCLQPGRKKDLCTLPREQGTCTQRDARWYFDQSENRCMPFYYSGCGGNTNRFTSREACEIDCPTEVERDTCTLPAQAGECHNYTDRWYFDTNDKRCRQFYFGGCGGNGNNFMSESECQQRCEGVQTTVAPVQLFKTEYCFIPSDAGPCRMSAVRWHYDSHEGVCKQFLYGGCQGNGNNFETRDECYQRCSNVQDLCTLPMIVGPCNTDYLQWFYEKTTDTCQEFNYGGCQGNENRFSDQQSCEHRCKKTPSAPRTEAPYVLSTAIPRFEPERSAQPSEIQICYSPVNVGNCSDGIAAWFYDAANQKCQAFVYTGCEGNANRFVSEEHCERNCGRLRGLDVCSHPRDVGSCEGSITKFYYDRNSGNCQEFSYSGCGGSGNRFSSAQECISVCQKLIDPGPEDTTTVSRTAICRLQVEVGPCEGHLNQLRWYFDEERATCVSFIYSGCGGNQNNFKSHQACVDFCHSTAQPQPQQTGGQNEIPVDEPPAKDPCETYRDECTSLLCPYGTEGYVDAENCNRCRCYDPCRDTSCPEETLCAIDLNPNASQPQQTQFIATCRPIKKDGECPPLSSSTDCSHECRNDADCSGELKCCSTGCGFACVVPAVQSPAELLTTYLPAYTEVPVIVKGHPPVIIDELSNTNVSAEEGSYITLKCEAQGYPQPRIIWRKGNSDVVESSTRHRLLPDGSLQIVGLHRNDAGTYQCLADNDVGHFARKDVDLEVTDPTPHSATIIGDDDTKHTVAFGAPTTLRCYAYGWPRPSVTWWRGSSMLPLSSSVYEQRRDHSLQIHTVQLANLGVYTCQAYNGLGKAASWSLTVLGLGPIYTENPEDNQFMKFVILAADKVHTPKPSWPYRPERPPPPPTRSVPTPEPYIPAPYTDPSPEIVPRIYTVPVRTNITMSEMKFPVASDISIPCDVDGHPTPQVQWYKDSAPLYPSERIQISESHRLTIVRANTSDSGEYICKAENEYSVSSSSVTIAVEGIYIHQNCTDNPFFANCGLIVQAHYCTHKYYGRFCCRSCTQAGQLSSHGPHLADTRQRGSRSPNLLN